MHTKPDTAGKVYLVGAGPSDPGLLTIKGLQVLKQAQVVIYDALIGPGIYSLIPPEAEKMEENLSRNGDSDIKSEDDRQASSTKKQDPNMQNQNYRMEDIGKNLQGKAEALNGTKSGRGESPAEEMKQMENELGGKDRELFSSGYGDQKPLDAGGSMLSGNPSRMPEEGQSKLQQTAGNRMAREALKNEWKQEDGKK